VEKRANLKTGLKSSIRARREELDLSNISLVKSSYLQPDSTLPLVVQPSIKGVNLAQWAGNNQEFLRTELAKHGGILFRDFQIDSPAKFEAFAKAVSDELFDEYGDLPREDVGQKVYSSTPYPANKSILFHNESSHMHRWPMKIWFYCVKAAEKGGATPILDCRRIYQSLDAGLIERFTDKKLLYVRNFIDGLDVSWQQFFQTSKKEAVEAYCRKAGIEFEWKSASHLTTRQLGRAVVKHPYTGEMLFFNQIQLHHVSCLDPEVREAMISMFRQDELPRNVYYGDGSPIEDAVVQEISALYDEQAVRFQWQAGDVIMLDNMMVSHSRDPFEGPRKILVAMAEIVADNEVL
jgi:alpha-ketoglutarate-dependent taurine dioxygenase